jgi:Putative metallopeptidase family (DUF6782)
VLTHGHRQRPAQPTDALGAGAVRRRNELGTDGPASPALIGRLQSLAGNRATSALLGRSSPPAWATGSAARASTVRGVLPAAHRSLTVQRDPLAAAPNKDGAAIDPGTTVDPTQLPGDGEGGPKPSDWSVVGGGGGPLPDAGEVAGETLPGVGTGVGSGAQSAGAVAGETLTGAGSDAAAGGGPTNAGGGPTNAAAGGGPTNAGGGGSTNAAAGGGSGTAAWMQQPPGSAIAVALGASAIGRDALAVASRYAVQVVFQAKGRPAVYDAGDNHCYLDPATRTPELATYFVHEMHHARQAQEGRSPLPDKAPDREAWVDLVVNEEILATSLSFEARVEMGISTPLAGGPLGDAWTQYLRVWALWRQRHLVDHPGDDAGASALARTKGRALIRLLIVGEPGSRVLPRLGPDQYSSYAMFYRRQWNLAHGGHP